MYSPRLLAATALIVLVYLGLGLTNIVTRPPWCDEGWFGNPAYNLAYKGFMGTTVLDPASSTWKSVKLTGIDRHTYWVMPLNLLANAAGFRIFGFAFYAMRLLSLWWGLVALAAWGAILWKLTGRPLLTLGALALIAVDYHFLMQASDGRMDAMAVALGWSGVAAYLLLRERNFSLAVAVSQTLDRDGVLHPSEWRHHGADSRRHHSVLRPPKIRAGDRSRSPRFLYLVIAAGWALYIAQSPSDFVAQFLGNAARTRTHHHHAPRGPATGNLPPLHG